MKDTLIFRPADPQDLERLALLVNSAYRGDTSRVGWTTEADFLDGQRTDKDSLQELISNNQVLLLAESQDSTLGLLGCVYLKKKSEHVAYLGMLTVFPKLQAQGLGRQILKAGEVFAQEQWLAKKMEMTVVSIRQELISWYERRGYLKTTKTEPFPYGDSRFGIPKRQDLEFIVLEKFLEVSSEKTNEE